MADPRMKDAELPLVERIDLALKRIHHRQAPMRIPVEATDHDVVLSDCREVIHDLVAAGNALARIHDEIAAEDETEVSESAFERWNAGLDALLAAIAKAEGSPPSPPPARKLRGLFP